MEDLVIMPNGNIKLLNVALGETLGNASIILSEKGINCKRNKGGYIEGKGSLSSLNVGTSLTFAKSCSIQFDSEWTGTRIVQFIIYGLKGKEINEHNIIEFTKQFAANIGKELVCKENNSIGNVNYYLESDMFEISLGVPLKDNGYISMFIGLKNTIQHNASGEYNYRFINELFISHLNELSKSNNVNNTRIYKYKGLKKEFNISWYKIVIAIILFVIGLLWVQNNRYYYSEKGRVRVDKWKNEWQIYDDGKYVKR